MDKKKKARKKLLSPYNTKRPKPANNPGKTQVNTLNSSPTGMSRLGGY